MTYPQPPWSGYPPPSYPQSPPASGHENMLLLNWISDLRLGQAQTVQALRDQTEVLREIKSQLVENAATMTERLPAPSAPSPAPGDRMGWRDWAQIIIAGMVVGVALAGRIPMKDAISVIAKPFGF